MKQTQKLDALISKIIKEELEESDYMFLNKNDPKKIQRKAAASKAGVAVVEDDPNDPSSTKLETSEAEEMQEPEMEQKPKASEIAGQVAEIMEKLKSMAEGEDPKKGKHAAKVMKYMESAKAALEALTAHETMLEEKDQKAKEDDATKQLKGVRKQLDKILKDKEMAERVMEKMSVQKMIDLKSKAKKDIDEAGLARIMVKHSLKESWIKKKVI
jgi:hypothetical protein